jgi:hypothetical protein
MTVIMGLGLNYNPKPGAIVARLLVHSEHHNKLLSQILHLICQDEVPEPSIQSYIL